MCYANDVNGLNPYFNGTCSKSEKYVRNLEHVDSVLILILMEHAQRGPSSNLLTRFGRVLILILMEHAQRDAHTRVRKICAQRLNPYFNGTCSKRRAVFFDDELPF